MLARSRRGMCPLGRRRTEGPSWYFVAAIAFALGDVLASLAFEVVVEAAFEFAAVVVVPRPEVVFEWIAATEHGAIVARIVCEPAVGVVGLGVVVDPEEVVPPRIESEWAQVERGVQSVGAAAAEDSTSSPGCPVLGMVARMLSAAAVVGPVALLAATESVPEVGVAPVAAQQHMRYYVPGQRADLEWGYPVEAAGNWRRASGMRYSRADRISLGSTHILAVGR